MDAFGFAGAVLGFIEADRVDPEIPCRVIDTFRSETSLSEAIFLAIMVALLASLAIGRPPVGSSVALVKAVGRSVSSCGRIGQVNWKRGGILAHSSSGYDMLVS